jgi:hypothetical protein
MDDPKTNRATNNLGIPVSSLVLTTVFHVPIIVFAFLWSPPTTDTPLMPEDAVELTIERQTTSLAAMIQPMAIPEPPVDSPPIQPAPPVPRQPVPQVESAPTPTLESALPEPEPLPELTLRDIPKVEPVVPKTEQKKLAPKADPKPDSNKVLLPAPGATTPKASPPTSLPHQADVDLSKKDERAARLWGTKYFERMGIRPSHQATLTGRSGRACPLDPEPYKLEIVNNKLTVTNDYGIMFSITVPANGEIDEIYRRAPMAGDHVSDNKGTWMKYRMMGNVNSGKLEIWYLGCVYTLSMY